MTPLTARRTPATAMMAPMAHYYEEEIMAAEKKVTGTFTNTQLLGINTTPLVILPATETFDYGPGYTKLFVPTFALLDLEIVGAYGNVSGESLRICLGSDGSTAVFHISSSVLGNVGRHILTLDQGGLETTAGTTTATPAVDPHTHGVPPTLNVNINDSLYDNAIALAYQTQLGALTGGNELNAAKVTVAYIEIDL